MRRDPLGLLTGIARTYGGIAGFKLVIPAYLVSDPALIKHVLQDRHQNYAKPTHIDRIKPLLGEGLLTSEGDFWRRQRRLAQPAFHRERIASFVATMASSTQDMLDAWRARGSEPFDASEEMMRLTLRIVGRTLMDMELTDDANRVGPALTVALNTVNDRFQRFVVLPRLPTPSNIRFRRALGVLDEIVLGIIAERRAKGGGGDDLLAMLMDARDEDGNAMNDRQLRDEVMTMVLAGHETTANALSWTWTLLADHPDVERRLHEEALGALGDGPPTVESVSRLPFTRAVADEAMRLYPPVWLFGRRPLEDDVIGGCRVRAGATVLVSPWVVHRSPEVWQDPERFDPERFLGEKPSGVRRFAHIPFAAGPRQCIGNTFAQMEATIVLAMIARRYRLVRTTEGPIAPEPSVTLRPKGGVPVRLVPYGT
jgi:cytochrome P450